MAATLGGGVVAALLCVLLGRIAAGFPPEWVESWSAAAPASLRPFLEELAHGFAPDLNQDDMPTAAFLAVQGALWIVMFCTGWQLLRRPDSPVVLVTILGFALLFRLLLLPVQPIHSADAYRYLWDGKSTLAGVNPYLYEPAALVMRERGIDKPTEIDGRFYRGRPWTQSDEQRLDRLAALRDGNPELYERITDANLPSADPPFAQGCFALASRLFGSSTLGFKSVVVFFDLGVIVLLLRLLKRLGLRRSGVIFYAWSPIVLMTFANAGHWDSIPLFVFLGSISLAMRRKTWEGSLVLATAGLGQAGLLAQVPVLFRLSWRHLLAWLFIGLLVAGAFAPFVVWQNAELAPILNGLRWTESQQPALPGVFLAVERLCGAIVPTRADSGLLALVFCGLLFAVFLILRTSRPVPDHRSVLRKSFAVAASLFLLSPAASPGQMVWVIPFLCAFPKPSWLLLMLTIQATYLQFHTDYSGLGSPSAVIPWVHLAVWGSFFLVCLLDPVLVRVLDRPVSAPEPDSDPDPVLPS